MSLRDLAASDLRLILEDDATGFGWPITVTDPAGSTADLKGFSADIHQTIDPDTGQAVSGRNASVSIAIASLMAAGLGIPKGVADSTKKPWVITFGDLEGNTHTFKVAEAMPDRTIGNVTCLLEAYKAADGVDS